MPINSPLEMRGLTMNPISGALVAGTTSTLTTTVIMQPILDGRFVGAFAAITNQAHPTVDFNTGLVFQTMVGGNGVTNAVGQGSVIVYGLVAGVVRAVQGTIVALDIQNNFLTAPQFPSMPAAFVPFAYVVVKARAADGLSIIVGTTAWASFNQAFVQIAALPARPQIN